MPTRPELERFSFLDDDDRDLIALRRTDAHRPGTAVRICTVRYIGRFLGEDPLPVPWEVMEYLAGQLDIADASCVKRCSERRGTPYAHAQEIRERFKHEDFTNRRWARKFRGFLDREAYLVRAGATAPRAEPARRVRRPVEPAGRPAGEAAERAPVGGDAPGRAGGPVPERGHRRASGPLTRGLDAAWRQMTDRLEEAGADAKVEAVVPEGGGRARLSVDKPGAVGEPESLTWLKNTTEAMLPRIDLPDLLFEVQPEEADEEEQVSGCGART